MPELHGSPADLSKSEFAALLKRSPQAVSGWIKEGKIHGPAILGEGHRARIHVQTALEQLGISLDLGQQLAQEAPILVLDAPPPPAQPAQQPAPMVDDDQRKLLRARREREELDLSIAQAKAREFEGHWVETTAAADAWARELAALIRSIETWLLTAAASDIAALDSRDPRAIGVLLKQGFRDLRQRIADQAAAPRPEPAPEAEDEDEEDSDAEV